MSEEELSKELTDEIFNDFDQALDELKRLIGIDTEEETDDNHIEK